MVEPRSKAHEALIRCTKELYGRQELDDRVLMEICPRGNNKVVILYFLIHDKGLLFMLELYRSKT